MSYLLKVRLWNQYYPTEGFWMSSRLVVIMMLLSGLVCRAEDGVETQLRQAQLVQRLQSSMKESIMIEGQLTKPGITTTQRLVWSLRQIDCRCEIEQVKSEQVLLKPVTSRDIPASVNRKITLSRLEHQVNRGKKRVEAIEEALKTERSTSLSLSKLESSYETQLAQGELNLLVDSKDDPGSKAYRVKKLRIRERALHTYQQEVRAQWNKDVDRDGQAQLQSQLSHLEHQLEAVAKQIQSLDKE